MTMSLVCKRPVLRHYKNAVELVDDTLAEEHCLEISLDGRHLTRLMCTPGADAQLVLGYLYTERLINGPDDVGEIRFDSSAKARVLARVRLARSVSEAAAPIHPEVSLDAGLIFGLMRHMEGAQAVFQRTGGTHSAALFDQQGRRLALAEDIGRHNALDKIIGQALQGGVLRKACVATMTSRLSSELVEKAAAAGLRFLCGISVATSLAVDMAAEHGITLIGRIRGGRMNVYTHKQRVLWPNQGTPRQERACDNAS